jgi:glutamate dehydrogenase (NAD(P)+)
MPAQDQNFYGDVMRYFDRAAAFTQHPSGLLDQIKGCNSVYRFEFPLYRPDGDVEVSGLARRA